MPARRSFAALVFLLVFTLIQGVAPLLHAHVQMPAGPGSGIHLPDGAAIVTHGHPAGSQAALIHAPCGLDEGALVTAAAEHRRDDTGLPPLDTVALVPTVSGVHAAPRLKAPLPTAPAVRRADSDAFPPYSTGPPALA